MRSIARRLVPLLPRGLASLAVLTALSSVATLATAAPATTLFEGVLTSGAGTPAADGDYKLTFRVYADATAQQPLWEEGPVTVKVTGGRFQHALGSSKPVAADAVVGAKAAHISVQVGGDPALPRQPLHGTLYALRAGGLACTGCVGVSQLKFDGDVDLGGQSLKAKNGTFTGNLTAGALSAASVTANSFVGDGSKLTGIAQPKGDCKAGEVVVGIAADGTLKCQSTAGSLPKDGLNTVSNGALSNEFTDVFTSTTKNQPIPDNTGVEAVSVVSVPSLGTALELGVNVQLENTDLFTVSIALLPPDDKKVGWVLCDPCGLKDAKQLNQTWTVKNPPKSGDIKKWIGADPKGIWTLKIKDVEFCVPQKPGNNSLCDAQKTLDGQLKSWSVTVKTLANSKVQATGGLVVQKGLQLGVQAKAPAACTPQTRGLMYVDDATDQLLICRKTGLWGTVVIYECGNKKVESGETCDDGNVVSGDGCDSACQVECGNGQVDKGEECDPKDPKTVGKCSSTCKLIKYGKLWLESNEYQWYPVPYPHATYSESKAVALCKSVGLRLWRDEPGSKTDVNWAYDYNNNHNLGGHDICYKVNSATSNQQQTHTGTWKIFSTSWANDIKELTGATNGQTVTVLNHLHHSGSNETQASWCDIRPQATSVQWSTQSNGTKSGMSKAVVLCAKGK